MKFKSKIKLSISILILIFIFFTLFVKKKKNNYYYPENNLEKKVINFQGNDLFSNEHLVFKNSNSNNRFTIINIWASWCVPCKSEHKFISFLAENKNVNIIGLNYKDKTKNAIKFLEELGNPYDFVFKDYNGLISIELGAFGVPETYLIDGKGFIIKKFIGPIDKKKYKQIDKLLKS